MSVSKACQQKGFSLMFNLVCNHKFASGQMTAHNVKEYLRVKRVMHNSR